jgi:hypothetical protein
MARCEELLWANITEPTDVITATTMTALAELLIRVMNPLRKLDRLVPSTPDGSRS